MRGKHGGVVRVVGRLQTRSEGVGRIVGPQGQGEAGSGRMMCDVHRGRLRLDWSAASAAYAIQAQAAAVD